MKGSTYLDLEVLRQFNQNKHTKSNIYGNSILLPKFFMTGILLLLQSGIVVTDMENEVQILAKVAYVQFPLTLLRET